MNNTNLLQLKEYSLSDHKGFFPAVCKTLSSIIIMDNLITLDEFIILSKAAKQIGIMSDNPLLINTLTMYWILQPTRLQQSIKELKKSSQDIESDVKQQVFAILSEIADLQDEGSKIKENIADALNIEVIALNQKAKDSFSSLSRAITEKLAFNVSRIKKIKNFAKVYNLEDLLESTNELDKDSEISSTVLDLLQLAKSDIQAELTNFEKVNKSEPHYEAAVDQLNYLTEIMIQQIKNRLQLISTRIEAEKKMFEKDYQSFISDTVTHYELIMKDRLQSSDHTRSDIWDFADNEASVIIQDRYNNFKYKYDELLRLWNEEVQSFSDELSSTQEAVLKSFNRHEFNEILPNSSLEFDVIAKIDRATSGILFTGAAGAFGATMAISAGIVKAGAVTALLSNPIGLGMAGTVGLAGVYKLISRSDVRVNKQVHSMRDKLIKNLEQILGDPVQDHTNALNEIQDRFYQLADIHYKPVLINSKLASMYKEFNQQVISKISDDTHKYLQSV